jgi:hypothetical protein
MLLGSSFKKNYFSSSGCSNSGWISVGKAQQVLAQLFSVLGFGSATGASSAAF